MAQLARLLDSDLAYSLRKSPAALASLIVVAVLVPAAILAPLIAPTDPFDPASLNLMNGSVPPMTPSQFTGDTFLLGTDDQGRGVFSAILYGLRISLFVGFSAVLLALVLGVTPGLIAAYFSGWTETAIMRVADVQLTFPAILVAMLIFGVAKGITPIEYRDQMPIWVLILAIGLSDRVQFARVVRGATLVEKGKEYVQAARLIGRSRTAPCGTRRSFGALPEGNHSGVGDSHEQQGLRYHQSGIWPGARARDGSGRRRAEQPGDQDVRAEIAA